MNWLQFFRVQHKSSAAIAKERLQVVVAHRRRQDSHEFLPRLQKDLLEVIRKYVTVGDDAIRIDIERDGGLEVLELNIVLPEAAARN